MKPVDSSVNQEGISSLLKGLIENSSKPQGEEGFLKYILNEICTYFNCAEGEVWNCSEGHTLQPITSFNPVSDGGAENDIISKADLERIYDETGPSFQQHPDRNLCLLSVDLDHKSFIFILKTYQDEDIAAWSEQLTPLIRMLWKHVNLRMQHVDRLIDTSYSLFEAEERERGRVADVIHDDIGQNLSLLRIMLSRMKKHRTDDKNLESELGSTLQLLDDVIEQTHELVHETSDTVLQQLGLKAALTQLQEHCIHNMDVTLTVDWDIAEEISCSKIQESIIYRAIREAVINAIKHAGVDHIRVQVECNQDRLEATVSENGKGFDINSLEALPTPENGYGLFRLREQLRGLGGNLIVTSTPGKGTTVQIILPLRSHSNSD